MTHNLASLGALTGHILSAERSGKNSVVGPTTAVPLHTTPCKMSGVTYTPVILHGVVSPEPAAVPLSVGSRVW